MAFAQSLLRKMLSDSMTEKHYDVFFIVSPHIPTVHPVSATTTHGSDPSRDPSRPQSPVDDARLGAHRVVLSAVSDHFQHFATPSDEHPAIDHIRIDDCSPAAVREALEIIYGGDMRESQTSINLALDLWRFGVRFHVDHLINLARSSCLSNLSTDNCLRILDFAVRVDDSHIVDKLQNYASENAHFSHVITSPDFLHLHFDVVSSLVRPGNGECAWPEILTYEKVWFDALANWLSLRISSSTRNQPAPNSPTTTTTTKTTPIIINNQPPSAPSPRAVDVPHDSNDPPQGPPPCPPPCPPPSHDVQPTAENIALVEKVLALVDFSRMKTHELRDISKNSIARVSPSFSAVLVDVLLARSEQLEASILERNIDLDVIGQKYQQALCEHDEAERKARAAVDKLDKLQAAKLALERRMEDMRRKRSTPAITGSSGPASLNSARRKMSGSSTII